MNFTSPEGGDGGRNSSGVTIRCLDWKLEKKEIERVSPYFKSFTVFL